ncbi:MAG TPA: non-homologous end-joining DNA ligase [Actinomycetota bacterium]|nr:non-homologous end-joining DNA ligase [Actinomycetota bacterium]
MPSPSDVEVTRPDKLLWPEDDLTKRTYVDYLLAVADVAVPWLRDRPLTLVRAPDGVAGERYFQKAISPYAPPWIRRITLPAPSAKRDVDYVVCDGPATLAWLGNQAALELHPAPVRVDRLERPDLLLLDIDPPDDGFDAAVDVVLATLDVLDEAGLVGGVKTTGGKGLHVVVPIERRVGATELRRAAARITDIVAERRPGAVTSAFKKAERAGRVMIDPSRNAPGATFVAPYSPRARDGAPVSFPVVREELPDVAPDRFTVRTVPALLDRPGPRAWQQLLDVRQRLPSTLTRR